MLPSLGVFFLLFSATLANPIHNSTSKHNLTDDVFGYRLPTSQKPSHYKLDLILTKDSFDKNSFKGTVEITFKVTDKLKEIKLHAPMTVNSVELKTSVDNRTVGIKDFKALDDETSIRTISLSSELDSETEYVLKIGYTGQINDREMHGLYKGSYKNGKAEEYFLATQFEPVAAREAFPCFDEPAFKATFVLTITYPKEFNVLSNTQQNGKLVPVGTDQMKATFKKTPNMSTYLVAFVVSKFDCDSIKYNDITTSVCSRPEAKETRKLALEQGNIILKGLEDFTKIPYKNAMSKMDQVALSDFEAGAMENWGLVTYRERLLLFDENECSNNYKQSVVSVIAHEFTHQWFGDLVTCDWWDQIFLNEGFAAYFQYHLQIPTYDDWELGKQFVVTRQQSVMIDDASVVSKALTAESASPSEIHKKFDTITYYKGSSILKMMSNIMGSENFKAGLQKYLNSKSSSNAALKDLLDSLSTRVPSANLPRRIPFVKVIDDWFNKPGYPVITVKQEGNNITVNQERFLYVGNDNTNSTWYVPISYTTETEKQFENVAPKAWLNRITKTKINNVFTDKTQNDWVILNNQQNAFYRVQYSKELWERIVKQLKSEHTVIDVLNRAQIVDDILNFARANYQTKYSEAFERLDYLKSEIDYIPWVSALNSFNYLLTKVGEDTSLGRLIKTKYLELLNGVYKTVSFGTVDQETHIDLLKKELILNAACRFGAEECISNANKLYQSYKINGTKVDKNLKTVVYCNGLRNSQAQKDDWDFLWQKYQESSLSAEQVTILTALGCSKDTDILKNYLGMTMNKTSGIHLQDLAAVWTAVYTSSPEGIEASLDHLVHNHAAIKDYTPDAASLLTGIAAQISNKDHLDKLTSFIDQSDVDESYKTAGAEAVAKAAANLASLERVQSDLIDYLKSGTSRIGSMSSVVLAVVTVFIFLFL